jgi:hypothetical protein
MVAVTVQRMARHSSSPAELKARLVAERRGSPFVLYRDAEGGQRIVELAGAAALLHIGRDEDSDIALPWDGEVSRVHAQLERVGRRWTMVDDGCSRNGSFVNGDRLHGRRRLKDGDVLRLGATPLFFFAPPRQESQQTAPAGRPGAPPLSAAQRRVLVALCRPFADGALAVTPSNRQIAAELVVATETVKTHLRALFEAFGLRDTPPRDKRALLVRLALERGAVARHELDAGA